MVARKGWGTSPLSVARREGRVREVVLAALAAECGNVTAAARRLGVDTPRLYVTCKAEGVDLTEAAFAARKAASCLPNQEIDKA